MKASELIEDLKKRVRIYGDREVKVLARGGDGRLILKDVKRLDLETNSYFLQNHGFAEKSCIEIEAEGAF